MWVIADGMGGHDAGDMASQSIVEALAALPNARTMSAYINSVDATLQKVNQYLQTEALIRGNRTIGATVVVLLAWQGRMACLWAGDSRAYCLRQGQLIPLSRDHSIVEDMVAKGELQRDEAESHPNANIITRAIGAHHELELDLEQWEIQDGDRYLLCSDGLYKELSETEITSIVQLNDVETCCTLLMHEALSRGARDNTSLIVIDFNKHQV